MRNRGMFFRENPFYLLGVHSRDTAETIRTASLEKQGAAKSREEKHMYRMAEERLLHERLRFRAELSWLCGMDKECAYSLIGGTGNMEKRENLPPSLRLLLAVHDLYNGGKDAFSVMETIIRLYPASDTNEVLVRIEADRKTGGFPPIKELFLLDIRKEELLWEIGVAAGRLNTEKLGRVLTVLGKADVPCSMALARFLSLYEEKTKAEVAALSRDLRYALRLAEMYPLQGLLLTEEKMKVYGKAVSPFYAMLHHEGLPDAVEIFFEEYVNEAFFFHKKGEKETALALLGCFLDSVCGNSRHIEKVKRWKIMMSEDRLTESVPYPKRKLERTTAVPKTVDHIPVVTLPRQSGGPFYVCLAGFLTAAVLCRYFYENKIKSRGITPSAFSMVCSLRQAFISIQFIMLS